MSSVVVFKPVIQLTQNAKKTDSGKTTFLLKKNKSCAIKRNLKLTNNVMKHIHH